MFKKILVPLDGSEFGECSLGQVEELATSGQALEVTLISVIEQVLGKNEMKAELGQEWMDNAGKTIKTATESYLSKVAEKLGKKGLNVKTIAMQGNASEKILDYAANNKIDLIVISTHGQSGIVRWAIGSVADKVVRHSSIPVLLASPKVCRKS
jgi:nucleotide-binding universal stress UspA family protein